MVQSNNPSGVSIGCKNAENPACKRKIILPVFTCKDILFQLDVQIFQHFFYLRKKKLNENIAEQINIGKLIRNRVIF